MKKLKKKINKKITQLIQRLCLTNQFLASIYYIFANKSFRREIYSTLYGNYMFHFYPENCFAYQATLNRNIHRLEKGLSYPDRKDFFAESYIEETIKAYKNQIKTNPDKRTLKWAYEVLEEYFSIVEKKGKIKKVYEEFKKTNFLPEESNHKILPIKYSEISKSQVAYDEFYKLIAQRKAVRWFKQKKVELDKIEKAVQAALLAPSACNRQCFKVEYIDKREFLNQIVPIPYGTAGFGDNLQGLFILIGDLSAFEGERDRHLIYLDIGLFAMTLMYTFETMGLATCPLNWPDVEEKELKLEKFLKLKPYERCVMLLAVGYPDEEELVLQSQRRDVSTILRHNNVYTN